MAVITISNIIKILKEADVLTNDNELLYSLLKDEKLEYIRKNMPSFFQHGKQLGKTSNLSWNFEFSPNATFDFDIMADAYFECSMELINKYLTDNLNRKMYTWVFPILYNAGHSIELKLKSIYLYLYGKNKKNHKWINLIEDIEKYYIDKDKDDNTSSYIKSKNREIMISLKVVNKFLKQFLSKTDDVTFVRYPVDKNMKNFFYNKAEKNTVFDLTLFRNEYILSYYLLNYIVELNYDESSNS